MRWTAKINVRHDFGMLENVVQFDELEDLQDIVEGGVHFGAIDKIVVTYNWDEKKTVEELGRE